MQKKRYKNGIWLYICLIFVSIFVCSIFYIQFIQQLMYKNVYHNIMELSEQTATQLNITIINQKKFVEIIADSIEGGYLETEEDVFKRFSKDLDSYHFTRLVLLDELGNGSTSDGYVVTNYPNIEEFFQNKDVNLSENRPSTVSDYQVNIYSKTVVLDGQKRVLFAIVPTENYQEILSRRLFNGEGRTYLINKDGSILIDSFMAIKDTNIYHYLKHEYKGKSIDKIEEMKEKIQNLEEGTFDISYHKDVYFINYEKIGVNDWYVVTIASNKTIAKELFLFLMVSFCFCLLINFIIIGVFIYIYLLNQKKNKKIYETAYIDSITLLGNESYFKEHVKKLMQSQSKNKYVAVLDINQFKNYNKLYEYEFCNKILKMLGQKLQNILPKGSIVSRSSRDIFILGFSCLDIDKFMDKILKECTNLKIEDFSIQLNLSIGIYPIKKEDTDVYEVLDKAYMAHSHMKGLYSSHYYIFDQTLENRLLEEQKIESAMEQSLLNGEFKVVYQPKVDVVNEKFSGAEALVRWHRENEMISPSKFIPIFEKNKFIVKLDLYVFEQVCKDMSEWIKSDHFDFVISINLSKEHFIEEHFIDTYIEIMNQYHIDAKRIEFEITESATIDSEVDIFKILKNIKNKGFSISIDDFGTGYSSLSMLQNMPVDVLKIDKLFVDNADLKSSENLINYISFMAQRLGIKTIVEGVETKEQVSFIKQLKCDKIQGYYYSKPLSKEEFEKYFKDKKK